MAGRYLANVARSCSYRAVFARSDLQSSISSALRRGVLPPFAAGRFSSRNLRTVQQDDLSHIDEAQDSAPLEELESHPPGPSDEALDSLPPTPPSPPPRPQLPGSIKKLNRLLGRQQLGEIPEHELKEQFVRGSGPGGQAINKTSSSVSLIHLPTGVRVQAQPTRSREANRKAARRILAEKLDIMIATGSWIRDKAVKSGDPSPETNNAVPAETRKESRKKEEVEMAEKWSRQEIIWEKERRRKANRAKKSKKKKRDEVED